MANTNGILVASTTTSSRKKAGNTLQPSAQVVAHRFSTLTEMPSSEKSKMIVVLSAMLLGLTSNTISGDVMHLSIAAARRMCIDLGISKEDFDAMIGNYKELTDPLRKAHPLAF